MTNHPKSAEKPIEPAKRARGSHVRLRELGPAIAGHDYPRDRAELDAAFRGERECHRYLERLRWPAGFCCSACGASREPWRSGSGLVACATCRAPAMATAGTIFQTHSAPLKLWLRLLWEVADRESCMSVARVRRTMRFSSEAAAVDCIAAVRRTMALVDHAPLQGIVGLGRSSIEISASALDHGWLKKGLIAIAVQRSVVAGGVGRVRLQQLHTATAVELSAFAERAIEAGAEVHTGPWGGYRRLARAGYCHRIMARGEPTIAAVEHVASLMELWLWSQSNAVSGCGGMQGGIGAASLDEVVDELAFRFNHRSVPSGVVFYRLVTTALHGPALAQERPAIGGGTAAPRSA